MKKKFLVAVVILFISCNLFAQTSARKATTPHRVVLQLSSNDTLVWKGLLNNIKNLKNDWGDSVLIEVVAHGPGIEFLVIGKTTQHEKIAFFKSKGVVFAGCENTLTEKRISIENIIPEAGFVKTGVGEIILKQEQGWSYIKVGF